MKFLLHTTGGMGSNVQVVSRSHALSKSNLFVVAVISCGCAHNGQSV